MLTGIKAEVPPVRTLLELIQPGAADLVSAVALQKADRRRQMGPLVDTDPDIHSHRRARFLPG